MYKIKKRYQTWTNSGKVFCRWMDERGVYETKSEAQMKVKELKETVKSIEQATKLKYEFEIEEIYS